MALTNEQAKKLVAGRRLTFKIGDVQIEAAYCRLDPDHPEVIIARVVGFIGKETTQVVVPGQETRVLPQSVSLL